MSFASSATVQRGGDLAYEFQGNYGRARAAESAAAAELVEQQLAVRQAEIRWRMRKNQLALTGHTKEAEAMGPAFPGAVHLATLAAAIVDGEQPATYPVPVRLRPAESTVEQVRLAVNLRQAGADRGALAAKADAASAGGQQHVALLQTLREREQKQNADLLSLIGKEFAVRGGDAAALSDELHEAAKMLERQRLGQDLEE
jgi:hypothetical protein